MHEFDKEAHEKHKEGLTPEECIEADNRLRRYSEIECDLDATQRSEIFLGVYKVVDNEAYYVRSDGTLGQSWTDLYQPPKVHSGYKPMPAEYVAQSMQALDLLLNGGAQRAFVFSPAIRADGVCIHPGSDRSYCYELVVVQNALGEREIICLTKEGDRDAIKLAEKVYRNLGFDPLKPISEKDKPGANNAPKETGFALVVEYGPPLTSRNFTSRLDGGTVFAAGTGISYSGESRFIDPFLYKRGDSAADTTTVSNSDIRATSAPIANDIPRRVAAEHTKLPARLGEDVAHPHQVTRGAFMDGNLSLGYSSEATRPGAVLLPFATLAAASIRPTTFEPKSENAYGAVVQYAPQQTYTSPGASHATFIGAITPSWPRTNTTSSTIAYGFTHRESPAPFLGPSAGMLGTKINERSGTSSESHTLSSSGRNSIAPANVGDNQPGALNTRSLDGVHISVGLRLLQNGPQTRLGNEKYQHHSHPSDSASKVQKSSNAPTQPAGASRGHGVNVRENRRNVILDP